MARAAILGTGLIGRGWAVVFARSGWDVALWDAAAGAAEAASAWVSTALGDLAEAGLSVPDGAGKRVRVAPSLAAALDGADYAQESVPEDAAVKGALFAEIGAVGAADLVAGSSSSTIPGSRFLADVPGRERFMVAHPANPPHLMPVVELVPSPWHDEATVARFRSLLAGVGQVPVVVRHEVEGFVMNRLQTAVVNEALALVAAGAIAPDDLDRVMRHSLGLRWAFMGPFETMDLNAPAGFADYAGRYGHLYQALGRTLGVAEPWQTDAIEAIEASRRAATPRAAVAERMRWRDRALMRLLALKRQTNPEEASG